MLSVAQSTTSGQVGEEHLESSAIAKLQLQVQGHLEF